MPNNLFISTQCLLESQQKNYFTIYRLNINYSPDIVSSLR